MKERRVVVTGLGILSPVGNSIEESWSKILNGKSGVTNINYYDTSAFEATDLKICKSASNSFGFGGTNAVLAFQKYTD